MVQKSIAWLRDRTDIKICRVKSGFDASRDGCCHDRKEERRVERQRAREAKLGAEAAAAAAVAANPLHRFVQNVGCRVKCYRRRPPRCGGDRPPTVKKEAKTEPNGT